MNNTNNVTYRCVECQKKYMYNQKNKKRRSNTKTKIIQCVDCGIYFEVGNKDTKSCRCFDCKIIHKRILKKEYRNKKKLGNI